MRINRRIALAESVGLADFQRVEILQELIPEEIDFYMIGSYLFHSSLYDVYLFEDCLNVFVKDCTSLNINETIDDWQVRTTFKLYGMCV